MATHSSTLAWKIPWTEDPGRLQSMASQRVGHDWANRMTGTFFVVVAKSCATLFHPMSCSTPGFPVLHRISDLGSWSRWCHPTILSSVAPLFLPSVSPSIRVFSIESALCIRWPKYWSFSFSTSPSNEYSGLISFRIDWFALLQSKGLSRVFSSTTIRKHQFFGTQPSLWSNSHICIWLLGKPYLWLNGLL